MSIDRNRVTLIIEDGTIINDGMVFTELDFSSVEFPTNVRVVQWNGTSGEIEFSDGSMNEQISELPSYVNQCVALHTDHKNSLMNPSAYSDAEILQNVKSTRDSLLIQTDWIVLPDTPFTSAQKTAWKTYRQSLRDLSAAVGYPFGGVYIYDNWPTPPSSDLVIEPSTNSMNQPTGLSEEDLRG